MEGNDGRAFYSDHRARRAAALECFARYYGERAREPRRYVDIVWPAEQWTRGAYGSFNPPGVITAFRGAGSGRVGPMRFAGSDLSSEWTGYMEGALRSGVAAAEAALGEL
jgi:monoamine oxidase